MPPEVLPLGSFNPYRIIQSRVDPPTPVVISCPHAGRVYPTEFVDQLSLEVRQLRTLEDFAMDQLVQDSFASSGHFDCLINNVARAYIDVNRPADALVCRRCLQVLSCREC